MDIVKNWDCLYGRAVHNAPPTLWIFLTRLTLLAISFAMLARRRENPEMKYAWT
jgi:hypothetical protein